MFRLLTTLAALTLSTAAMGQEFTILNDADEDGFAESYLLEAVEGTFYKNGLGKPSVVWDGTQWVMYFETWAHPDDWPTELSSVDPADFADCTNANASKPYWFIGRATSPDGLDWTVDQPVVWPVDGTYYRCSTSHPAVVFDGSTWHMWFAAGQAGVECDSGTEPSWGCLAFVGIGYATSADGISWTIHDSAVLYPEWGEEWSSFGYPAVTAYSPLDSQDFTWLMLVSRIKSSAQVQDDPLGRSGDIMMATATDPGGPWTVETNPAFEGGFQTWISDRVYSPTLQCYESETMYYSLFFGGKSLAEDGDLRGFGLASGDLEVDAGDENPARWFVSNNSPFYQWVKGSNWTGWDTTRIGDDYLVWYAAKDDDKNNRINMAYSSATTTWDLGEYSNRICDLMNDVDGDGWEPPEDCDDTDENINPDATEICNEEDDDCDGDVDELLDCDGDSYADPEDCDDTNAAVNPGATEICGDGIDNDCDDDIDEADCYIDADEDGYAEGDGPNEDCDDTNANINPGMDEDCANEIDDDCDGDVDGDDDECGGEDTGDTGFDAGGSGCCNKDDDATDSAIPALLLLPLFLGLRRRR